MQKKEIIPAGSVSFKEFPEKILLQGKQYQITILLKNKSANKEIPVDFYLKYRTNGFKILDIPENLKSKVWFSMPYDLEYPFSINIEPTIEGPLQFEINLFGKKVTYSQVEKTRQIEVEVEKEFGPETSEVPVILLDEIRCEVCKNYGEGLCKLTAQLVEPIFKCEKFLLREGMKLESDFPIIKKVKEKREEKYLEEKMNVEEVLVDSSAIYMEAINAGQSANLENFMILGDVSSNVDQIKASTIIFYFPLIVKPGDNEFLRLINKKMFEITGQSFFYLNFPLSQKLSQSELKSITEGINKFLPKIQHLDSKLIFNLDFIPKLEKPTIILGKDENGKAQEIQNFLLNKLGNNFNIILDSNIFQGGKIFEHLTSLCSKVKIKIINLVLSEHFKEDYNLFIEFLNTFSNK
ncbi:MAG: hypothetical protein ACTSRG_14290 [Candidatus Helarchaeota archaeon]